MTYANQNAIQIPAILITPIPAFQDNYIWLLHNSLNAVVVDPGDAKPVIAKLKEKKLILTTVLITHYHADHINGVEELIEYAKNQHQNLNIYAPQYEPYTFNHIKVGENDEIYLPEINQTFKVLWLPGHTNGHIAYVNDAYLFCGDTLFGAGCGRLFEGTPAQMLDSLNRIKALNKTTQLFCTHEYTAKNIQFALELEPDNQDLINRQIAVNALREKLKPSLPSTIDCELKTNPFLRCAQPSIFARSKALKNDDLSVFTAIRILRNHY